MKAYIRAFTLLACTSAYGNDATTNAVNLKQLGACGVEDGTVTWNAAQVDAISRHIAIYLPAGCKINHRGVLVTRVSLIGEGSASILNATDKSNTPHSALLIAGDGVSVDHINFQTTWVPGGRSGKDYSAALAADSSTGSATHFKITNNLFTSTFAGPDIQLFEAGVSDGEISNNHFDVGALSNPFIAQAPFDRLNIRDNSMRGGGDNCIELVDYSNSKASKGTHVDVINNELNDSGIYIASESRWTESPANNIVIASNTIDSPQSEYGISVLGTDGYTVSNVEINGNRIATGKANTGINVGFCPKCEGPAILNVSLTNNVIDGDGIHMLQGISVHSATENVNIESNTINHAQHYAIYSNVNNSGTLKVTRNKFSDLSLEKNGAFEAIKLSNPGFADYQIVGNTYIPGSHAISNFLTCLNPSIKPVVNENTGPNTTIKGCAFKASQK
jgi:hypothetical protein